MNDKKTTVREELIKLVTKRFPKITYNDCVAWVQEIELELARLTELQVAEDKANNG